MNLCISINSLCPVWVVPSCCAQMQSSPSTRREWFLMESTETQPSSEVKNVISESSFFSDLYLRLPEHQVPFQISIHVFISLRQKKYSVYSHISPILTFDKFKPGMFGGFGKIKNLIYFLSIDQSIHQLIVFGCIEHVSVGWVAAVVDDATDCCVLCRYHRRGDRSRMSEPRTGPRWEDRWGWFRWSVHVHVIDLEDSTTSHWGDDEGLDGGRGGGARSTTAAKTNELPHSCRDYHIIVPLPPIDLYLLHLNKTPTRSHALNRLFLERKTQFWLLICS